MLSAVTWWTWESVKGMPDAMGGEMLSINDDGLRLTVLCQLAHQLAYEKAGILHRDISAGNIYLRDTREGLLIDWELSANIDVLNSSPRRPRRTVSLHEYVLKFRREPDNSYP
jgi:serine/threonine protein kinase